MDGVDVWDSLSNNLTSPRNTIIHNIDEDLHKDTWQVQTFYALLYLAISISHNHVRVGWGD